ncbi:hypothetical protein FRC01_005579 [Tulasnella sp. 417]|nr:hypothetical protein FRC01_005579 [Tulasnella sp. 417]
MLVLPPSPSHSAIINLTVNSSPATSPAASILPPPALPTPSVPSLITPLPVPSTSSSAPSTSSPLPPVTSSSTPPGLEAPPPKRERRLQPAPQVQGPPPPPLTFPFPYQRCYACGPELCDWCAKNQPPLGHKNPIPDFIVATIIRHAMPHRFETLEQIHEREIASGTRDRKLVGEREEDGMELEAPGPFTPPAWTSDKARPKKSCLRKRESNRFTPYSSRPEPTPLGRRTTEEIKVSLDEALTNRITLNYEGPIAIAIRNEVSAINVPNEEPFKWEPEYTGPPAESFQDVCPPVAEAAINADSLMADLTSSSQEDIDDEAAVIDILLPRSSKKRRYDDDDEDAAIDTSQEATQGSPTKKQRTTRSLVSGRFPGFVKSLSLSLFSSSSSIFPSPASTQIPSPSPIHSVSPSSTLTAIPTNSESSLRKRRIAKKKLQFQFTNPSSRHPKFGVTDSIYFHHHRLDSPSKNLRKTKLHKTCLPSGKTWSPSDLERATRNKSEWDGMRKTSFERKTSRENLGERLKRSEAIDALAEKFQRLVDKYEASWPAIDLAGVRARYIRPRKNEIPHKQNKETIHEQVDVMRQFYPTWDHCAWDGVDRQAIAKWKRDPHYKLRVCDVMMMLMDEEMERKGGNVEPDAATDIATVMDEDEARMRREYLAAEVEEVADPAAAEGGLRRQGALCEADFVRQLSAQAGPSSRQ